MSRPAAAAASPTERDAKRLRQRIEAQLPIQPAAEPIELERRVPNPSAAQDCHSDALHLSLKELLRALRSCRDWSASGIEEASRELCLNGSAQSVAGLAVWPFRHHIDDLCFRSHPPLRLRQLRLLRQLPHLTALITNLQLADPPAQLPSER